MEVFDGFLERPTSARFVRRATDRLKLENAFDVRDYLNPPTDTPVLDRQ